jgi:hypothetical protein
MWPQLCMRLGGVTGAFTALIVGALRVAPCCASPPDPALPIGVVLIDGLVVALIVALIVAAFAILVTHRSLFDVVPLALLIAVLVALIVSYIAYLLGHQLWAAVLVGGILGAIIGWLVCWLFCGQRFAPRTFG